MIEGGLGLLLGGMDGSVQVLGFRDVLGAGCPGAEAGVQLNDVIVKINGKIILTQNDASVAMRAIRPGERVRYSSCIVKRVSLCAHACALIRAAHNNGVPT
jgi:hypothetical protein